MLYIDIVEKGRVLITFNESSNDNSFFRFCISVFEPGIVLNISILIPHGMTFISCAFSYISISFFISSDSVSIKSDLLNVNFKINLLINGFFGFQMKLSRLHALYLRNILPIFGRGCSVHV